MAKRKNFNFTLWNSQKLNFLMRVNCVFFPTVRWYRNRYAEMIGDSEIFNQVKVCMCAVTKQQCQKLIMLQKYAISRMYYFEDRYAFRISNGGKKRPPRPFDRPLIQRP